MATTQTELQQALALRKANPNMSVRDAVSQVRANQTIANAPVAGQPPAITNPVGQTEVTPEKTTKQLNQEQLLRNQAKVQGEIMAGTRPEVGTKATPEQIPEIVRQNTPAPVAPAPVNAQENAPAPATPTPATTPTPTTSAPTPTSTPTTPNPKTPKVTTPVVKPPTIRDTIANQKIAKYAGMTSQNFIDLMKQGQIPSAISSQLAQTNPQFQQAQAEYAKIQRVNNMNQSYQAVANGLNGIQSAPPKNPLQEISDKYMALFQNNTSYAQAFKDSLVQNDTLRSKTQELNAKQGQINEKVKQRDQLLQDYKNQYKDVPLAILVAMASRDAKPINDEILTLQNERDILKADVDYETELAKGEYDAKVKDMETQQALRNAVLSQVMSAEFGMATKQAEIQMEQALIQQALKDPATAVTNLVDEYKKMGVPFTRSTLELIQEAQNYVNSGGDLASYLTNLNKTIQTNPEYKRLQEVKAQELTDTQKLLLQEKLQNARDIRNFEQQKELAYLNRDLGRQEFLWQLENDPEKKAKAYELERKINANKSLFDILGKNVGTYEGNRGYDLAGNIGDPIPAGGNWKVISIDTAGEQKGSIFMPGKGAKPYGNTVVMEDENGNQVRYSHLESIGVKPGDILGFGDIVGTRGNTGNVLGKNGEKLTKEQLAQGRGAHVDIEIKDPSGRLLSQSEQVEYLKSKKAQANEYGDLANSIIMGTAGLTDLTPTLKEKVLPILQAKIDSQMTDDKERNAIIKSSIKSKELDASVLQKIQDMQTVKMQLSNIENRLQKQKTGPILGYIKKMNPYDTEAQVALAELAGITPKVARGIFGEVGVLTDADIENYQRTLPNLTSTEEKNAFVVNFMRKLLAEGYKNAIVTQAKGGRNMAEFLSDYDEIIKYQSGNNNENNSISVSPEQQSAYDTYLKSKGYK